MPETPDHSHPAPVAGCRKSSFSAQIPNLRPNNPIIRYRKSGQGGWNPFTFTDFDQKMAKNRQNRGFLGVFPGGVKKGHFWGGGLSPRGGQKGGFCLSNLHSFWPKRQIWSKRAIFWNFGHFGGFWGFWGFFGVQKVVRNGNFGDFWGFPWGGRKWPLLGFPDEIPD